MLLAILRSSFRGSSREQCGIMIGSKFGGSFSVARIFLVPNVLADDEEEDYGIAQKDYERAKKSLVAGEVIRGFVHTHLRYHGLLPSDEDYEGCAVFPQYKNLVYKPDTEEAVWYGLTSENDTWLERVT